MSVRSQLIAVAQPAGLRAQRFAGLQRLQPAGKPLRCSLCLPPAWARPACSRNGLPGKWRLTIKLNDAGHDDPGACPRCSSTRLQARVGRHVTAAAGRALVTISADHPSWGDGWVVCRTARCGNVDDADNRIRAAAHGHRHAAPALPARGRSRLAQRAARWLASFNPHYASRGRT